MRKDEIFAEIRRNLDALAAENHSRDGQLPGEEADFRTVTSHWTKDDCKQALERLTRRLEFQRQVRDRAGMCRTLFNIGYVYRAQGETQEDTINTTIHFLVAYWIARQIGETRVLRALEKLAHELEVVPEGADGLAVWERLAAEVPPPWE
uniref:Uncharacterized protein n=1 Tax=Candidatus Kentrum sp. FW TaxID=2126338 RepID=A0A450T7P5_9GAMM|nr:MAG: hypothetical protein BECKFW1821B_GA0114236_105517 [Candidatus Kentron sp. FW]VFJ62588.1 MAG: hypothetical protein BECKFW1821A_GA0114235_11315 [Candidatus Kentron sp. FW]